MNNKTIIDLIKEELEQFDFLSNQERLKEQKDSHILANEDFQKQFIKDSLIPDSNKIKYLGASDVYLSSEWESELNTEDVDKITLTYNPTFEYTYDSQKPPIKLQLYFDGNSVPVQLEGKTDVGDRITPGSAESWFDFIDWNAIDVDLLDEDGNDYEFTAFKKAPRNLQAMFIKEYVGDFIKDKTNLDIRT